MRTKHWFAVMVGVLVIDAITVTWITAFHIANAQPPTANSAKQDSSSLQQSAPNLQNNSPGNSAKSDADSPKIPLGNNAIAPSSDLEVRGVPNIIVGNPVIPDDVTVDVQPPQFLAPTTGQNSSLPEVPSLSAPQLPLSSISDAVRDEMRKMFSEQSSALTLSLDPESASAIPASSTSETHDSFVSLDRRFEIVRLLSTSARLLVEESRLQAINGQVPAAKNTKKMTQQLRSLMSQLLQPELDIRSASH